MIGTIKLFHEDRGYGFIRPDDAAADVFFHVSALAHRRVRAGDRVSFEMGVDPKKGRRQMAIDVQRA
jgi:CspA family cold shock protein